MRNLVQSPSNFHLHRNQITIKIHPSHPSHGLSYTPHITDRLCAPRFTVAVCTIRLPHSVLFHLDRGTKFQSVLRYSTRHLHIYYARCLYFLLITTTLSQSSGVHRIFFRVRMLHNSSRKWATPKTQQGHAQNDRPCRRERSPSRFQFSPSVPNSIQDAHHMHNTPWPSRQ